MSKAERASFRLLSATPAGDAVGELQPGLLKRGDKWSFSAVLSGPVEVSIKAPLVDTDVTQVVPESARADVTVRFALPFVSAEVPLRFRHANDYECDVVVESPTAETSKS